jgi:DNA-binding LytR/AlgR family response regulator
MDRSIRALIIDDESGARTILKKYLEISGKVEIIGNVPDSSSAMYIIKKESIDVVFLDINMPHEDGLQFASRLRDHSSQIQIVFTTAYKDYALQAFKVKPIDYLVKPFGIEEVFAAIDMVEDYFDKLSEKSCSNEKWGNDIKGIIKLKVGKGFAFVHIDQIVYMKSVNNSAELLLTNGQKQMVKSNINEVFEQLKYLDFFRVNRSALVNMAYISRVDRKDKTCVVECNGEEHQFMFSLQVFRQFELMNLLKLG